MVYCHGSLSRLTDYLTHHTWILYWEHDEVDLIQCTSLIWKMVSDPCRTLPRSCCFSVSSAHIAIYHPQQEVSGQHNMRYQLNPIVVGLFLHLLCLDNDPLSWHHVMWFLLPVNQTLHKPSATDAEWGPARRKGKPIPRMHVFSFAFLVWLVWPAYKAVMSYQRLSIHFCCWQVWHLQSW